MAGKWEHETPAGTTLPPAIYVQEDRYGKPRYKAAYRALSNGKSVVTSRTFSTINEEKDFLADIRIKGRNNALTPRCL